MTPFLIALFALSLGGIIALLSAKHIELEHGRLFFAGVRPAIGAYLGSWLTFVERRAPHLLRRYATEGYTIAKALFHRGVALLVLHTERLLERTLQGLRGATGSHAAGSEASEFLREVAEHKKTLLKKAARSKKQPAIYEE